MGPAGFFLNGVAKTAVDLAEERRQLEGERMKQLWRLQFESAQETIKDWRRARQEAQNSADQSYQRRVGFIAMGGHPAVADYFENSGLSLDKKENLDRALQTTVDEIEGTPGTVQGSVPFTKRAQPDIGPIESGAAGLGMKGDEYNQFMAPYRNAQPIETKRVSDANKGYRLNMPDTPAQAKTKQEAIAAVQQAAQSAQIGPDGKRVPPEVAIQKLQGIYSSFMRNKGIDPSTSMSQIDWPSFLTGNVTTGQQVAKEGRVEGAVVGAGGTPQQGQLAGPGGFGARATEVYKVPNNNPNETGPTRLHNPSITTQMHPTDPNLILQTDRNQLPGSREAAPVPVDAPPAAGMSRGEQFAAQNNIRRISGQVTQIDRTLKSIEGAEGGVGLSGKIIESVGGLAEQNFGKIGAALSTALEGMVNADPGKIEVLRTNVRALQSDLHQMANSKDNTVSEGERRRAETMLRALNTSGSVHQMLASLLTVREILADNIYRDLKTAFPPQVDLNTDDGQAARLDQLVNKFGIPKTLAFSVLNKEIGITPEQNLPSRRPAPVEGEGVPTPDEVRKMIAPTDTPEAKQPIGNPSRIILKRQMEDDAENAKVPFPERKPEPEAPKANGPKESFNIPKDKDGKPDRVGKNIQTVSKDTPIDYADDERARERFKVAKDSELDVLKRYLPDERLRKLVEEEIDRRKKT